MLWGATGFRVAGQGELLRANGDGAVVVFMLMSS